MSKKGLSEESINVTVSTYRWVFVAAGAAAAVVGLAILLWPNVMGSAFSILIGIYALVAGLLYAYMVVKGKDLSAPIRLARGFVALALIVGGILILSFTNTATQVIVNIVGISLGLLWILEGVMALVTLKKIDTRTWLLVYAIVAIAAGVIMLLTPVWGAGFLVWLLGLSLLGLGIAQVVRGLTANQTVVTVVER